MKRLICFVAALLISGAAFAQNYHARAVELYKHYAAWSDAPRVGMVVPMADGEHFTRLAGDRIEQVNYLDGATTTLYETGWNVSDYTVAPNGSILIAYGAHPIYRHSFWVDRLVAVVDGREVEVAPEVLEKRDAQFSPDGHKVLFSSRNDLYLFDLEQEKSIRLTEDGCWNYIINGTTDWVYEEEFGFTKGFAFSPDSSKLAFLKFDESEVPLFEMMRFDGALYNRAYTFKYPKAGDKNSVITLWVVDLATGEKEQVETGPETDQYIPNLGWTPQGELYFYRVDRRQRRFEVVVDRPTEQQIIYSEQSERYVERPIGDMIYFVDDDLFIVREETTAGWWHLYLHSVEKGRLRALTSGEWEVTSLVYADKRNVWFVSTEKGSLTRHLYRVDLNGKKRVCITEGSGGYHTILPSADMSYYIDSYSYGDIPTQIDLCNGKTGKMIRTLSTTSDSPAHRAIAEETVPTRIYFTFTTERGDHLNAWMVLPFGFDSQKHYPVLLTQYSGPGSQEVADRWRRDWTEALTHEGYIVACVDGRGTGFRGEAFKKQTYGDLGRREVEDQLSFARYLSEIPYVDANRIGIYGWSYGGFMSLSCALKGQGLFKMAISVAPVTSWRYYDSVYTETYNGLPQEFAAGYDENSPLNFEEKLSPKTRLLLIHGSGDDNVHVQNTMEMARRLNQDGADYDMMIYPDQNHSMMPDDMANVRIKMLAYTLENL